MTRSLAGSAAAIAAALLVTACSSIGIGSGTERRTDGPLAIPQPSTAWFEVTGGEVFSEGFTMLHTSEALTIEQVRPTGDLAAVTFLGARLGLPGRPDDFNQRMRGYPPRAVPARYQEDAEGATMEPGETYMLILGFRVDDLDVSYRKGVEIDYDVDGTGYRATLTAQVVTCPPPLTDHACHKKYPEDWPEAG